MHDAIAERARQHPPGPTRPWRAPGVHVDAGGSSPGGRVGGAVSHSILVSFSIFQSLGAASAPTELRRVGHASGLPVASGRLIAYNMPDDRAAEADELSTLMATLRSEIAERDQRVDNLQNVLIRKTEEREVLFQNYQDMLGQVQILRQLVTQRLGLPEPTDTTTPLSTTPALAHADSAPGEVASHADSVPAEHAAPSAPADPVFWEQWVARVEVEVSSSKAVLDESLVRSAQAGRDSLAQLREGWTRGLDGLVHGFGSIAPRAGSSSTGKQ